MRPQERRKKSPRTYDPWDIHEEADVTSIQHWSLFQLTWPSDQYLETQGMSTFSDILGGVIRKDQKTALDDPDFQKQFPTIYMLMAVLVDDEGRPRKSASLTLVCEDGVVKLGLNERNHGLSLWTSSQTLGGAFTALEEACNERPPRWRKTTWEGRGKK